MKTCMSCGVEKELNQFLKDKRTKDGRCKLCVACMAQAKGYSQEEYEDLLLTGFFRSKSRYYESHKEKELNYTKKWRADNRDRSNGYSNKYHKENPHVGLEASARRRARQTGAKVNDFTEEQWKLLKEAYNYRCAYCGKTPDKLDKDHIIPLSRNGNHTLSNIVPACHPCNLHKHDRTPSEAGMSFVVHINLESDRTE